MENKVSNNSMQYSYIHHGRKYSLKSMCCSSNYCLFIYAMTKSKLKLKEALADLVYAGQISSLECK